MGDQVTKLKILDEIDPSKAPVDPKSTGSYLNVMITMIGDILLLIEIICATNPATIAISAVCVAITHIFGTIGLIKNLKTIDEL